MFNLEDVAPIEYPEIQTVFPGSGDSTDIPQLRMQIRELHFAINDMKKEVRKYAPNSKTFQDKQSAIALKQEFLQLLIYRLKALGGDVDLRGRPRNVTGELYKEKMKKFTCYLEPEVLSRLKELKRLNYINNISSLINLTLKDYLDNIEFEKDATRE